MCFEQHFFVVSFFVHFSCSVVNLNKHIERQRRKQRKNEREHNYGLCARHSLLLLFLFVSLVCLFIPCTHAYTNSSPLYLFAGRVFSCIVRLCVCVCNAWRGIIRLLRQRRKGKAANESYCCATAWMCMCACTCICMYVRVFVNRTIAVKQKKTFLALLLSG